MTTTKNYHLKTIPIIAGEYIESDGTRHNLGVGMAWHPGGDLDTEQNQQEYLRIRMHYPEDPAEDTFDVQISADATFANEDVTSDPTEIVFDVADGVAQAEIAGFTAIGLDEIDFVDHPGRLFFVRVRFTSGPWSPIYSFTPYYPSASDVYAASGLA